MQIGDVASQTIKFLLQTFKTCLINISGNFANSRRPHRRDAQIPRPLSETDVEGLVPSGQQPQLHPAVVHRPVYSYLPHFHAPSVFRSKTIRGEKRHADV